ncbi:sphingomyelin phosphodiesterase [Chytriomyces confervae]|uniref:Sphingomyelin phosphodiesterase n=1 Tax=Chytriomyces confervae TaxID=246404 RepID=A0A507F5F1_9FUNG|nr:sphingomyelin phosphodiesterase [Chytriomyces confervae]
MAHATFELESILGNYKNSDQNVILDGLAAWAQRANSDNAFRAATADLHKWLPTVCTVLFGSNSGTNDGGVIHSGRCSGALPLLMAPDSNFVRLLLRADPALKYSVQLATLPGPTQKAIAAGRPLPQLYASRIEETKDSVKMLTLNMLEYFIFQFTHVALSTIPVIDSRPMAPSPHGLTDFMRHPPRATPGSNEPSVPRRQLPSVSTSFRFKNFDSTYFSVLKAYLEFFVPSQAPVAEPNQTPVVSTASSSIGFELPTDGLRRRFGDNGLSSGVGGLFGAPIAPALNRNQPAAAAKKSSVSILNSTEMPSSDLGVRIGISQFVIGLFSEIWLCQNEYHETSGNVTYARANAIQMQCAQIVVSHVASLDRLKGVFANRSQQPPQHAFGRASGFMPTNSNSMGGNTLDLAYDEVITHAYFTLQKPVYYFLRLALKFSDLDDTFPLVVDIWISYITPWIRSSATAPSPNALIKSVGGDQKNSNSSSVDVTHEWVPFISQNFLFYSRLLRNYMERAVQFDLFAATRPSDLTRSSGTANASTGALSSVQPSSMTAAMPNKNRALFATLERVLQVFYRTKGLLSVLKTIDSLLANYEMGPTSGAPVVGGRVSLPGRNNSGPTSRSRNNSGGSISGGVPGPAAEWIERVGGLEVLGLWVRNRIIDLEGRMDYQSMFGGVKGIYYVSTGVGVDGPGIVLARTMLTNTYGTIVRLNTYLPVNSLRANERQAPSSPTQSKGETSPNSDSSNYQIWIQLWQAATYLGTMVLSSSQQVDKEREAKRTAALQASVSRLNALAKMCVTILSVTEEERATIEASVIGAAGVGNGDEYGSGSGNFPFHNSEIDDDDEVNAFSTEIVPGVFTPDLVGHDRVRLTAAGREQVKRGLRKSNAKDVPILKPQSSRVKKLVLSYEIEWIVNGTSWIAQIFDELYPALRERAPLLPKKAGLHWLRFFAAKQNLIFSAVLYTCFYIVWNLVWFLFIGGGGGDVVTQQGQNMRRDARTGRARQ